MPVTAEGKIVPITPDIVVPGYVEGIDAQAHQAAPAELVVINGGVDQLDLPATDISGIELTHNEAVNFYLASKGYDARSAAEKLGVSIPTVKTHRASTLNKLHVHSMQGAVAKGILLGKIGIQYVPQEEQKDLTDDQSEIIEIVALDFRYDEVANMVHKSTATVKSHVANLRNRLGAANMPHAVRLAFENQVITAASLKERAEELKSRHAA